jgi:dolichol kinase
MFIAAFAASIFFVWLIIPSELNIIRILILSAIATVVEACSPKEIDNLLIPTAVILGSII